jgi:hypothetical protein
MFSTPLYNTEDDLIDDALLVIVLQLIQEVDKPRPSRKNRRDEGQRRLQDLLDCDNNNRIKAALRMRIDIFYGLRNWLVKYSNLKAGKHVSVEMKIAIFLHITTRPASQRDTMEQYGAGSKVVSE